MDQISDIFILFFITSMIFILLLQTVVIGFLLKKSQEHSAVLFFHQKIIDKLYPDAKDHLEEIIFNKL